MFPQMFPGVGNVINFLFSIKSFFDILFRKAWDTFEIHLQSSTHLGYIWEAKGHIWDTFGMLVAQLTSLYLVIILIIL